MLSFPAKRQPSGTRSYRSRIVAKSGSTHMAETGPSVSVQQPRLSAAKDNFFGYFSFLGHKPHLHIFADSLQRSPCPKRCSFPTTWRPANSFVRAF